MKKIFYKIFISLLLLLNLTAYSCKKAPVTISQNLPKTVPQRILSLSPASTEILCALGAMDKIKGRSEFCDYPPEVQSIPVIGSFDGKTTSSETLLSYNPDFVYLTAHMHDNFISLLSSKNISYYVSTANSIEEIASEIITISKVLDNQTRGNELAEQILSFRDECLKLNQQKSRDSKEFPSIYWEIWTPPYMSIGNLSFINEIVTLAGGINIFAQIPETYPIVSDEAIIAANPDFIILPNHTTTTIDSIKQRAGWQNINAVKNNQIYSVDADIISRPGPRCVLAIQIIRDIINEKK